MSKPTWSEYDALVAIAAIPIEPLRIESITSLAVFACWLDHREQPIFGEVRWEVPPGHTTYKVTQKPLNYAFDRFIWLEGIVYYPASAYPVLAARFALEHRAHSPKEPT